jgi:alkanesulfonate monooxygenase SsuD/methylene tetrahydromethanopterin reductase-like flavin-dependent oxidoreductase (luciferase family)
LAPNRSSLAGRLVLFGARTPAALARAARLADGLNPIARSWSSLEQITREFPEVVRQAGRDPQQMLIVVRSNHLVSVRALPEPRRPLSGSLEQIREDVQRLESLGIRHVFFALVSLPVNEQLGLLEKLRRVADGE